MKQIGNVQLDEECYQGTDLYCDGAIEDEMLEIAKNVPASEYNRIIQERKSWPILYHFSNVRENIVSSMQITKEDRVLEVGAGCGAITGALARMAGRVDAVDLSMKRSMINAYRHRDCGNLTLYVGNFQEVEQRLLESYDVITLIGVLEYGGLYIHSSNPYVDFLKMIRRHLKPDGRLIVAIENRYGLKYWAGCREDHTGVFFESIEGYRPDAGVCTFSRKELGNLLEEAGFCSQSWYYPYPDYKLPEKIFSDEYLPEKNELNSNDRNFDRSRFGLFNENKVYQGLIEEGLFPEFSNSYLIVAQGEQNG